MITQTHSALTTPAPLTPTSRPVRGSRRLVALTGAILALGLSLGVAATPAHAAAAWGGNTNGKIPLSELTQVSNGWLRSDAAAGYVKMDAAFQKKFHKPLRITEGYRSYTSQVKIFKDRYEWHSKPYKGTVAYNGAWWLKKKNVSVAAVPGTSIHGWALAVDFNSNVNNGHSLEKKWADKYGPKYGWLPIGNKFGEPWHFEFTPPAKK